jgi:hypothetical protein
VSARTGAYMKLKVRRRLQWDADDAEAETRRGGGGSQEQRQWGVDSGHCSLDGVGGSTSRGGGGGRGGTTRQGRGVASRPGSEPWSRVRRGGRGEQSPGDSHGHGNLGGGDAIVAGRGERGHGVAWAPTLES